MLDITEQRIEEGLKERIAAFENKAISKLLAQVAACPVLKSVHDITLHTSFMQTKSRRSGQCVPITLSELKRVPTFYGSQFELSAFADDRLLAEENADKRVCLFNAFTPIIMTNSVEVIWYDYEKRFIDSFSNLLEQISHIQV